MRRQEENTDYNGPRWREPSEGEGEEDNAVMRESGEMSCRMACRSGRQTARGRELQLYGLQGIQSRTLTIINVLASVLRGALDVLRSRQSQCELSFSTPSDEPMNSVASLLQSLLYSVMQLYCSFLQCTVGHTNSQLQAGESDEGEACRDCFCARVHEERVL